MSKRPIIVLTGGPCGGKTTLIRELLGHPSWSNRVVALPEAISVAGQVGISPRDRLFQRLMVELQAAMEKALDLALGTEDSRAILCHRGTLDPLAYWLHRGWPEKEFFTFTRTCPDGHYQRYTAVIHLVTAAKGASEHYQRWPHAHRPESPAEAIRLDQLLQRVWSKHSKYFQLDNEEGNWMAKSEKAQTILKHLISLSHSQS
jgi:hypothetical protein